MNQITLQSKMKTISALLCVSILIVWAVFYMSSARNIRETNIRSLTQVQEQIVDRMEKELLGMESFAFSLTQSPEIIALVKEKDPLEYHRKTPAADRIIASLAASGDFASSVLLFDDEGVYTCFIGAIGNTASKRIGNLAVRDEGLRYTTVTLEGVGYISCISRIYENGEELGFVVVLAEQDKLLGVFSQDTKGENLQISVASEGTVVVSSDPNLMELTTQELEEKSALYLSRQIPFAPFEICTTIAPGYLAQPSREFAAMVVITSLLFLGLLLVFLRIANRHFFKPMVTVLENVKTLDVSNDRAVLESTGNETFDSLVDQINLLVSRLNEKNHDLLDTQMQLQQMETEQQRALVISLKKQISAHFIVNVLSIINVLSKSGDKETASKLSDSLSRLLHYVNAEDEFASGMEEMDALEQYITIMKIRYPGQFTIHMDWDDRLFSVRMLRMLIQPLVENAILHGVAPAGGTGRVEISGRIVEQRIVVTVTDDGLGMNKQTLLRLREEIEEAKALAWGASGISHVALANIQRRIWSYYGGEHGLEIRSQEGQGTIVTISLPAVK